MDSQLCPIATLLRIQVPFGPSPAPFQLLQALSQVIWPHPEQSDPLPGQTGPSPGGSKPHFRRTSHLPTGPKSQPGRADPIPQRGGLRSVSGLRGGCPGAEAGVPGRRGCPGALTMEPRGPAPSRCAGPAV